MGVKVPSEVGFKHIRGMSDKESVTISLTGGFFLINLKYRPQNKICGSGPGRYKQDARHFA
jgi:hypothetical protein